MIICKGGKGISLISQTSFLLRVCDVQQKQAYAQHTSNNTKANDVRNQQAWTVSAQFHPLHFTNDYQIFECNRTPRTVRD